jgi:hypothetical protein
MEHHHHHHHHHPTHLAAAMLSNTLAANAYAPAVQYLS